MNSHTFGQEKTEKILSLGSEYIYTHFIERGLRCKEEGSSPVKLYQYSVFGVKNGYLITIDMILDIDRQEMEVNAHCLVVRYKRKKINHLVLCAILNLDKVDRYINVFDEYCKVENKKVIVKPECQYTLVGTLLNAIMNTHPKEEHD